MSKHEFKIKYEEREGKGSVGTKTKRLFSHAKLKPHYQYVLKTHFLPIAFKDLPNPRTFFESLKDGNNIKQNKSLKNTHTHTHFFTIYSFH